MSYATDAPKTSGFLVTDQYKLVKEEAASADDWVRSHPREISRHTGRWLAVAKDGIVSVGDSLPEVRAGSIAKGFDRAQVIVFKIPSEQLKKAVRARKP